MNSLNDIKRNLGVQIVLCTHGQIIWVSARKDWNKNLKVMHIKG